MSADTIEKARRFTTTDTLTPDQINSQITTEGRRVHAHCSSVSGDVGMVADNVHEEVAKLARGLCVTGKWDDENLVWETDEVQS